MDQLTDWFNALQMTNEQIKEERGDTHPYQAVTTPVVELIYLMCSLFELPTEVRYLSVEIFDRFASLHFQDLHSRVWKEDLDLAREQWKKVEEKLREQTPLRILSCIQIASKFVLHSKALKPKEIQSYLRTEGMEYTLKMIISSEMRVWKTLNFRIYIPTVMTYVDLLLEQLGVPPQSDPSCVSVHERAALFTDLAYLYHHEIYKKLFYLSTGRWDPTPTEKRRFRPTECDTLYRASALVALTLTVALRDPGDVYLRLGNLTQLLPKDIQILAEVINQVIMF
uniref:Cyclin N-terminal domain-containing protein n=1 Tax=Cuerna arida TaxID=1464854 RepID=A0A1B6GPG3_9HEMI